MLRQLLLLAPLVAFATVVLLRAHVRGWLLARRLARVAHSTDAAELERALHARDEAVREAAAARLVALAPSRELVAKVASLPRGAAGPLARALAASEPALAREAFPAAVGPARLRWACALA